VAVSNGELLAKAESPLLTEDITYGLLNPEQAKRFIRQMFDVARTTQICRTVVMSGDKRYIDKMGIGSRIARAVDENEDVTPYTKKPSFGRIELDTVKIALPWELSEETLEDTIEQGSFEDTVATMMTNQFGLDLEDLYWNGDTSLVSDPEESGYLEGNELLCGLDGWLKQLDTGSHIVDAESGALEKDELFSALRALPAKYRRGPAKARLRWYFSSYQTEKYKEYLTERSTSAGDFILMGGGLTKVLGVAVEEIAALPDDVVVLTDPKNLVVGVHRRLRIRRTTEGKEAVMTDKRYYCAYARTACATEEKDAAVKITNIATS